LTWDGSAGQVKTLDIVNGTNLESDSYDVSFKVNLDFGPALEGNSFRSASVSVAFGTTSDAKTTFDELYGEYERFDETEVKWTLTITEDIYNGERFDEVMASFNGVNSAAKKINATAFDGSEFSVLFFMEGGDGKVKLSNLAGQNDTIIEIPGTPFEVTDRTVTVAMSMTPVESIRRAGPSLSINDLCLQVESKPPGCRRQRRLSTRRSLFGVGDKGGGNNEDC